MLMSLFLFIVCVLCGALAGGLTFRTLDKMRLWSEEGLAALIPLGICSLTSALLVGGLVFHFVR